MIPRFKHSKLELWLAFALGLMTFVVLVFAQADMGIPRDESVYFEAGERYMGWLDDWQESPVTALSKESITKHFQYNREHPALPKILFGLSHQVFTKWLGWTSHMLGARLPALVFSSLLIGFTFLLGVRINGVTCGIFAALGMLLIPRHFYHMQLACFDVPVTAAWVMTVYFYLRSLEEDAPKRFAILAGLCFGLGIAVKHNIYFLPPLLVLHWVVMHGRSTWRDFQQSGEGFKGALGRIPKAFWSMAFLGPLVLVISWPFLWYDGVDRFIWYVEFHAKHVHYPWQYLGESLREPPFPWHYTLGVTALTMPLGLFVLSMVGFFAATLRLVRDRSETILALLLLNASFSIVLIGLPNVPVFGGMKHWLPSFPFLLILGGLVLSSVAAKTKHQRPALIEAALAVSLLFPAGWLTARFQPYGTSAYNELAGLEEGAANLGMQRQYWSNNVTGVMDWLNEHGKDSARLYLHEVTPISFEWYKRDGWIRNDLRWASTPEQADIVVYQYHEEFRDREFEVQNLMGNPKTGLYLGDVPVITVYVRQ